MFSYQANTRNGKPKTGNHPSASSRNPHSTGQDTVLYLQQALGNKGMIQVLRQMDQKTEAPLQRKISGALTGTGTPPPKSALRDEYETDDPQKVVDSLVGEIQQSVGVTDRVISYFHQNPEENENPDHNIKVELNSDQDDGLYPEEEGGKGKIHIDPLFNFITHEDRDRLYQPDKAPDYSKIGFSKLKKNTPVGKLSPYTCLYHELGHAYQYRFLKIDLNEVYKMTPGKFIIELHNILQGENKLATTWKEPLRSTYRSLEGIKQTEVEYGKRYQKEKSALKQVGEREDTVYSRETGILILKKVVGYYLELTEWLAKNAKGLLKKNETDTIETIIKDSVALIESQGMIKESQIHLLQGIIDSMYYMVKDKLEEKKKSVVIQ